MCSSRLEVRNVVWDGHFIDITLNYHKWNNLSRITITDFFLIGKLIVDNIEGGLIVNKITTVSHCVCNWNKHILVKCDFCNGRGVGVPGGQQAKPWHQVSLALCVQHRSQRDSTTTHEPLQHNSMIRQCYCLGLQTSMNLYRWWGDTWLRICI